jgi:hypothetical protein
MADMKMQVRIDSSEAYNGNYYTEVTRAAADSFSKPSTFRLRSAQPLGQQGQMIEVICNVSGYVRHYNYTDKNTGQPLKGSEPNVYFDVEAAQPMKAAS